MLRAWQYTGFVFHMVKNTVFITNILNFLLADCCAWQNLPLAISVFKCGKGTSLIFWENTGVLKWPLQKADWFLWDPFKLIYSSKISKQSTHIQRNVNSSFITWRDCHHQHSHAETKPLRKRYVPCWQTVVVNSQLPADCVNTHPFSAASLFWAWRCFSLAIPSSSSVFVLDKKQKTEKQRKHQFFNKYNILSNTEILRSWICPCDSRLLADEDLGRLRSALACLMVAVQSVSWCDDPAALWMSESLGWWWVGSCSLSASCVFPLRLYASLSQTYNWHYSLMNTDYLSMRLPVATTDG